MDIVITVGSFDHFNLVFTYERKLRNNARMFNSNKPKVNSSVSPDIHKNKQIFSYSEKCVIENLYFINQKSNRTT